MTTLVISDIHNKIRKANKIIENVEHDRVVYLADYFDNFEDTPNHAYKTASWLCNRMSDHPEDIFLIGNHDTPYFWRGQRCPGFTNEKACSILQAFNDSETNLQAVRERLKLFTLVDGWLLSHAGFTNGLCYSTKPLEYLEKTAEECLRKMELGQTHFLTDAGRDRGGGRDHGGITWVDFRRFHPLPGVKQLVGHTADYNVRCIGQNNWCMDTHLKHYATITDGELEFFPNIFL